MLNLIVGIQRARMGYWATDIRNWILVSGFVLLATAIFYFLTPTNAGWLGGGLWGVLMLVPILGFRIMHQLALEERFGAASRLGTFLCWLHPAHSWRQYSELLWALEMFKQGASDRGTAIINRHKATNSSLVWQTLALMYQIEARWQDLREWIETELPPGVWQNDPTLAIYYLRCLGETGDINALLQEFERLAPVLERTDRGINQNQAQLFALAFCGQQEQTARLLKGPLAFYPKHIRQFWLATADWVAGDWAIARQQLLAISNGSTLLYRHAAQRRLSQPPTDPEAVLTPRSKQILSRIALDIQHRAKYSGGKRFMGAVAYATWVIIGLNLWVFLVEIRLGGSENLDTLYRLGALVPEEVLNGAWWRLLTSTFLHFGFVHLLMNMLGLYILGPFVELALGVWRYLVLYLTAGVGSMLVVSFATQMGYSQAEFVVGASGCVMGIIGATAAILLRGWRREKSRIASKRLRFILFIIAFQVVFDLSMPQISFTGHTAGLIIGFLVGSLLKHNWRGLRLGR